MAKLKIMYPLSLNLDYLPREYLELTYNELSRSYSIAHPKNVCNDMELKIRNVPNENVAAHILRFK